MNNTFKFCIFIGFTVAVQQNISDVFASKKDDNNNIIVHEDHLEIIADRLVRTAEELRHIIDEHKKNKKSKSIKRDLMEDEDEEEEEQEHENEKSKKKK